MSILPIQYALKSLNKARYPPIHKTIEAPNYNKDKLQYKEEQKKQSAEERRTKPRPDMAGIRNRLRSLARSTRGQIKTVDQYMEESKEWLVADDWKLAGGTIEEARCNLACLQCNLSPFYYLEGELVHYLDVLWPQYVRVWPNFYKNGLAH